MAFNAKWTYPNRRLYSRPEANSDSLESHIVNSSPSVPETTMKLRLSASTKRVHTTSEYHLELISSLNYTSLFSTQFGRF